MDRAQYARVKLSGIMGSALFSLWRCCHLGTGQIVVDRKRNEPWLLVLRIQKCLLNLDVAHTSSLDMM